MARCPKCEDKIRKGKDNWFTCKYHGKVRKVMTPESFLKYPEIKQHIKNIKVKDN